MFLEAQRALASALGKRGNRLDRRDAIEAWERVLELDPEAPKVDLLDMLLADLERALDFETVRSRFKRIKQLDLDGMTVARATRALEERATAQMTIGSDAAIVNAVALYELLNDTDGLRRAQQIKRRQERLRNIGFGGGFALLIVSVVWGFLPLLPSINELRVVILALSGVMWTWPNVYEKELKISFINSGAPFFLAAAAIGEIMLRVGVPFGFAGGVAWFVSILNSTMAPSFPVEKIPEEPNESGGPLVQVIGRVIKILERLRDRLSKQSAERK